MRELGRVGMSGYDTKLFQRDGDALPISSGRSGMFIEPASGWLKLLFVLNDDGGIWLSWGHGQAKLTECPDVILEARSGLVETVLNRMSHSAEAFKFGREKREEIRFGSGFDDERVW